MSQSSPRLGVPSPVRNFLERAASFRRTTMESAGAGESSGIAGNGEGKVGMAGGFLFLCLLLVTGARICAIGGGSYLVPRLRPSTNDPVCQPTALSSTATASPRAAYSSSAVPCSRASRQSSSAACAVSFECAEKRARACGTLFPPYPRLRLHPSHTPWPKPGPSSLPTQTGYMYARRICLCVKYKADTRYSDVSMSTHDKQMIPAFPCSRLAALGDTWRDYDVIGIDEGQFFPDVVEFSEMAANAGKTVVVAALDADYNRRAFGRINELLPLAESVHKLRAV